MEIRRAEASEAEALSAIARASKAHWPYAPEQIEAWREDLTLSVQQVVAYPTFVVEGDGVVVGFYQLLAAQETWVLEHLWVLPAHMGKGAGRALLQHAMDFARLHGAQDISIDADPHAEAFYAACGAETLERKAAPIDGAPDRVRPQMIMRIKE
jgi:GNAT superfamily N-acetyltransferase